MSELPAEMNELSGVVVDAALAVHRVLGPGYVEAFYEEALCVELKARGIPFERQAPLAITYRDQLIGTHRLDLMVDSRLIIELKAVEALSRLHFAQVLSYLRATQHPLALLINFNVPLLRSGIRRIISTDRM